MKLSLKNSYFFEQKLDDSHSISSVAQNNTDLSKLKNGSDMLHNFLHQKRFSGFSVSVCADPSGKIEVFLKRDLDGKSVSKALAFKGIPRSVTIRQLPVAKSTLENSHWDIREEEVEFTPKLKGGGQKFTRSAKATTTHHSRKSRAKSAPHDLPNASKEIQDEGVFTRKKAVSFPERRNGCRLTEESFNGNNEDPLSKEYRNSMCSLIYQHTEKEILDFSKGSLNEWVQDKDALGYFLKEASPELLDQLREVNLSSVDQPLAPFFKLLSTKCPNIDTIIIQSCNRINDIVFPALAQFKSLRQLDISNCNQISNKFLSRIVETFPKLVYLNISNCKYITNDGLEHITHLEYLKALDISNCNQITDQGLANLKNLQCLHHLWLSGCLLVTDKGLEFIQEKQYLYYLSVAYLPKVTKDGLKRLFLWDGASHLNVSGNDRLSFESFEGHEIEKINQLSRFNLSFCSNIKRDDLLKVNSFKNLQGLAMRGCFNVTEKESDACLTNFMRQPDSLLYLRTKR